MKILFTILSIILSLSAWANMASPFHHGTLTATPFISQHVDIVKEKLLVIPDKNFETAYFIIEYHIKASKSGTQIPLLFYASEFKENFRIWVDNQEVQLHLVPEAYKALEGSPIADFSYLFESNSNETEQLILNDSPLSSFYVSLNDLKFFKTDLEEGNHIIKVEYHAENWIDHSNWVKQYSFRYVLSPARSWKSFGNLEITLDNSNFPGTITTNLGAPTAGNLRTKAIWKFTSLPAEVLLVSYQPEITKVASLLVTLSPIGLTILLAAFLIGFHIIAIKLFRKKNPDKQFSWIMISGSITIPFIIILSYIYFYELIDFAIGPEASKYHGYTLLAIFLYPILLPVYWTAMWLVDRTIKRNYVSKQINEIYWS